MALIHLDSFDYTLTASQVWTTVGNQTVYQAGIGRTGANGFNMGAGGGARKIFPVTWTAGAMGAAWSPSTPYVNSQIIGFSSTGTQVIGINQNSSGQVFLSLLGSQVGSLSSFQIPIGQFHYFEVAFDISAGTATAYIDSVAFSTVSGLAYGVGRTVNEISVGNNGAGSRPGAIDDLYALDTSGGPPWNAPLGDCVITTMVPSASGDFAQFGIKPGSAQPTNWQNVNEIPPDSDTTYVYSATLGVRDSYIYPSYPPATLTGISSIVAVMEMAWAETDAGGSRAIGLTARQSGVDSVGPDNVLGVNYAYVTRIMQTDVNGNQWTVGNLNATQFGVEVTI